MTSRKVYLTRIFILVFSLFPYHLNAQSASVIVFNGVPVRKVMSDIEGTNMVDLTKDGGASYRTLVTKKENKYFWASRENRELIFNKNGEFYDFVEPYGRGYVRIAILENKFLYMEHLTIGFKNITYWGMGEEANFR